MTLSQKQSLFAVLVARLILWVNARPGWRFTLADGYRGDRQGHSRNSLHYERLAQDLNLFVDNVYITDGRHPAWLEIGEFWEGQHELCRWGGRFQRGYDPHLNAPREFTGNDSNHFSLYHGGRA